MKGHPATFVLDAGSASTIVSPKAYGAIRLDGHSLELANDGAGRLWDAKHLQADVTLTTGARFSLTVSVMNLDNASKQIGAEFDGILGEDILRTFSAASPPARKPGRCYCSLRRMGIPLKHSAP